MGLNFVSEDIIWEQFKILEEKVSELIKMSLEKEKADLAAQLVEKEKIVHQKEHENKSLVEERTAIRGKIDSILLKLDSVSSG